MVHKAEAPTGNSPETDTGWLLDPASVANYPQEQLDDALCEAARDLLYSTSDTLDDALRNIGLGYIFGRLEVTNSGYNAYTKEAIQDLDELFTLYRTESPDAMDDKEIQELGNLLLNICIAVSAQIPPEEQLQRKLEKLPREEGLKIFAEKNRLSITKGQIKWLDGDVSKQLIGHNIEPESGKPPFLWCNIISDSRRTNDELDKVDHSKREKAIEKALYAITSQLSDRGNAEDGDGNKVQSERTGKTTLRCDGMFKDSIYPVWKTHYDNTNYCIFVLEAEQRTYITRDEEMELPVFIIAIITTHTSQNRGSDPIYEGILGGQQ